MKRSITTSNKPKFRPRLSYIGFDLCIRFALEELYLKDLGSAMA